jgi:hypothetical protein
MFNNKMNQARPHTYAIINKQILDYVYKTDISKFKYKLLQYETDLQQLVLQKFYVGANFTGSNCLLIFTKINDKYCSYLIDRKTLSYTYDKIDMQKVKITKINIKLEPSIYMGTIMDGVYITTRDEKVFIINDIYSFRGDDFTNTQINSKLLTVVGYLNSNYSKPDKTDDIKLSVNKLYPLEKTEHLMNNIIPNKKDIVAKGVCFYPEISNVKYIYLFNNDNGDTSDAKAGPDARAREVRTHEVKTHEVKTHEVKTHEVRTHEVKTQDNIKVQDAKPQDNIKVQDAIFQDGDNVFGRQRNQVQQNNLMLTPEKIKRIVYMPTADRTDPEDYTFEMKPTKMSDVYDLNLVEKANINSANGKIQLKRRKICVALIPTIQCSKWCKSQFDNTDNILVHCRFHEDKGKWEPISISTKKRPSYITEFYVKEYD